MSTVTEESIDTGALGMESVIATILGLALLRAPANNYFLICQGALVGVYLLIALRWAAARSPDPNIDRVRETLRVSSVLSEFVLLGALAVISFELARVVPLGRESIFIILGIVVSLSVGLTDQYFIGSFGTLWQDQIYQNTTDNLAGKAIRSIGDFGVSQLNAVTNEDSVPSQKDTFRNIVLGVFVLILLAVIVSPVVLALSFLLGGWKVALGVALVLLFLRDTTRHLYIGYGAADSVSELRYRLRYGLVLLAIKGVVVAGAFGYDVFGAVGL